MFYNDFLVKVFHQLHLPVVTIAKNDDERQLRRLKSHEAPRSNPSSFRLMQIAEKYRKELREYNERTLKLPVCAQTGQSRETQNTKKAVQVPLLSTVTSMDEVEVVKETNSTSVTESGLEVTSPRSQETFGED